MKHSQNRSTIYKGESRDEIVISDADVQADIAKPLTVFPNLSAALPTSFPGGRQFDITAARLQDFSDTRSRKYWHLLNLPLVLHAYQHSPHPKVRSLMHSILMTLEEFIARLGHLRRAKSLLSPLWMNAWDEQPELWSVLGCAYLALCFQSHGIEVLGFETKIGSSSRNADITVRIGGKATHVEVEAVHRAEFGDKTDEEVRSNLARRAVEKAERKFPALPANEVGVVAEVCVVRGEDVRRRVKSGVLSLPDSASAFWMPLRLVGVADPKTPQDLRFAIMPL
jgi:hypothetical protein